MRGHEAKLDSTSIHETKIDLPNSINRCIPSSEISASTQQPATNKTNQQQPAYTTANKQTALHTTRIDGSSNSVHQIQPGACTKQKTDKKVQFFPNRCKLNPDENPSAHENEKEKEQNAHTQLTNRQAAKTGTLGGEWESTRSECQELENPA